ncbi:hypothetical protein [Oceanobacillus oncorhynchi]|uniref:hypothetical protein n=1 Tax=Oceanobacillus oncorhynchi TaxID=545501 RepID=UPI001867CA11|nr:hypothetical protein [Oceanobacillus oncorhynchi]
MITDSYRSLILSKLQGKYTTVEDFKLEIRENTSGNVTIYYRYNPEYSFTIYLNSKGITRIKFTPGEMLKVEEYESTTNPSENTFSTLIPKNITSEIDLNSRFTMGKIKGWVSNIETEMEITPENRKSKEHEEKIRNIEDQLSELFQNQEDSTFSHDEINELKEKLNKLEEELKIKIEEDEEKQESTDKVISELKKEMMLV